MEQTGDWIEALKRHLNGAEPSELDGDALSADQWGGGDAAELVAALVGLSDDQEVRGMWAEQVDFDRADVLGKVAWASSQDPTTEGRIDQMLESSAAASIVDVLARAGIAWDSPHIGELLDRDASRRSAALNLTVSDPDEVRRWLGDCAVVEDALEVLRAAALNVSDQLGDAFAHWHEILAGVTGPNRDSGGAEMSTVEQARLDGLWAVVDPRQFARRVLGGEAGIEWLSDLGVVADFLQVHGPTHWLEVLGILESADDSAVELASLLAVSAAAGVGFEEPDDDQAGQLLELLAVEPGADAREWEPTATALDLGFAVAIAADNDLGLLAAQAAAHERLVTFGFHSPGIGGLPLSATADESRNLPASRALLEGTAELDELPESTTVAVVRTLCDLRDLVDHAPDRYADHAQAWVEALLDSDSPAIRLAVRQLTVPLDPQAAAREIQRLAQTDAVGAALALSRRTRHETTTIAVLEEHARLESPLGLDCARRLAAIGTDPALEALARLWKSGSIFRVAFYRDCLFEAVVHGR